MKESTCSGVEFEFCNFYVRQISTSCLAQFSYYIESNKEAIIIDPMRDTEKYIQILKERGSSLKYIFETHFHADFVSGHIDLSRLTGASIVFGPDSNAEYDYYLAKDKEVFQIGNVKLKVLHTPGHTLESSCFVVLDSNNKESALFTGDTLFLNEVGRPDLAAKNSEITEKKLAEMIYDSIHSKIKPLNDDMLVFPGHGAGSACGKKISSGGSDTLKNQKLTNYVFNENLHKDEFIEILTSNLSTPPKYFFHDVMLNKKGYRQLEEIIEKGLNPISMEEYQRLLEEDKEILTLDTRDVEDFSRGFIPNSISVTLKTNYASWVGTLFDPQTKIIILSELGKEKESIVRLARIGYTNILGYLKEGINTWSLELNKIETIKIIPETINEIVDNETILDVREQGEWESTGTLPNSILLSLSKLLINLDKIPKDLDLHLLCRSGQRTLIAASLLLKNGFKNRMLNLEGGINKIFESGYKINNKK